jgi:hypothetical protein
MPPGLIGIGCGSDPGSDDPDGGAGHGAKAEGGVTTVRPVALFQVEDAAEVGALVALPVEGGADR